MKENIYKVKSNTGKAFECFKGQRVKVEGTTIVGFVAFNLHDLSERFDQASNLTKNTERRKNICEMTF